MTINRVTFDLMDGVFGLALSKFLAFVYLPYILGVNYLHTCATERDCELCWLRKCLSPGDIPYGLE